MTEKTFRWTLGCTLALTGAFAQAQNNAQALLEAAFVDSGNVYGPARSYERVALSVRALESVAQPSDALSSADAIAFVAITCDAAGDAHAMRVHYAVDDPAFADAIMVAQSFVPAPRTVVAGFLGKPYDARIDDAGVAVYSLSAADTGLNAPASLVVDPETARVLEYRVGVAGAADSIEVTFRYGATDEPVAIETRFASSTNAGERYALIDLPAPYEPQSAPSAKTNLEEPMPIEKGTSSGAVMFSDVVNTLPPINLGSTSCNASDAPMVNLGVVSIGADIAVGVSLNTNTTLTMAGIGVAEYPIEGEPGMAELGFNGNMGSSAIEYSLAYAATFCVSVDPIIGPTCNLSASLANGSVTVASGTQMFSPFLLPGDDERPVCTGDALNPFNVGVNPSISICDLTFGITGGLSIDPNLDYCVQGDSIDVVQVLNGKQLVQQDETVSIPAQGAGVDLMATWNGTSSLAGSLTVSPSLGITIPVLGDLNVPLPSFPFNLGTIDGDTFNLESQFRIAYPDIDTDETEVTFGDTEVGMAAEVTRSIVNMGEASLEIDDIVADNAAFTVMLPEAPVTVAPAESVDVVISFTPDATGDVTGMLSITSNDPDETMVVVALSGAGIEAPQEGSGEGDGEGDGDGDGDGNGEGRGCSSGVTAPDSAISADLLLVLAATLLLAMRRQRRRIS